MASTKIKVSAFEHGPGEFMERKFPSSAENVMSISQWNCFCDSVDRAYKPLSECMDAGGCWITLSIASLIGLCLLFYFLTHNEGNASCPGNAMWATAIVLCILLMLVSFAQCVMYIEKENAAKARAWEVIWGICDQATKDYKGLLFAALAAEDTNTIYIRVSRSKFDVEMGAVMQATAEPIVGAKMGAVARAVAQPLFDPNKSAKERFFNLEQARIHLTDKEYEQKRVEIIATS